jgi:hypothetical protein
VIEKSSGPTWQCPSYSDFTSRSVLSEIASQGRPIEPAALANEVIQKFPNYRHLKKHIASIVVQMVAAMNSAEITAHFRRPKR